MQMGQWGGLKTLPGGRSKCDNGPRHPSHASGETRRSNANKHTCHQNIIQTDPNKHIWQLYTLTHSSQVKVVKTAMSDRTQGIENSCWGSSTKKPITSRKSPSLPSVPTQQTPRLAVVFPPRSSKSVGSPLGPFRPPGDTRSGVSDPQVVKGAQRSNNWVPIEKMVGQYFLELWKLHHLPLRIRVIPV